MNKKISFPIAIIIIVVFIILMGLIISINLPLRQTGPQIKPCNWVFKTDPTNIGHIGGTLNSNRTMVVQYSSEPDPIVKLNNDYFTMAAGCAKDFPYTNPSNFVFFKATTLEELRSYDIEGETVDTDKLKDSIKDDKPFDELYFCFKNEYGAIFSNSELNNIISNNQLEAKCQKII